MNIIKRMNKEIEPIDVLSLKVGDVLIKVNSDDKFIALELVKISFVDSRFQCLLKEKDTYAVYHLKINNNYDFYDEYIIGKIKSKEK